MKVFFYCQYVWGMGHLFRSIELVRALAGHDVVLVAGGREVDIKLPDHVTLVRLPGLYMDEQFTTLITEDAAKKVDDIQRARKEILFSLLEEHQPDVMRRAGDHLARLTSGRYTRIAVDDAGDGNRFILMGPGLPGPIQLASPISTGTLEQAYLSLRLAIVDHLDQGLERLPLFVDELFVNWDERRRRQGLEILKAVAGERQLFTFTCHTPVARELEAGGARVVVLDSDR